MESQVKSLLKNHSLRLTQGRKDVLTTFLDRNVAISHSDIETAMDGKYDRVTIYRTLKSFLDKGLIHKVLDDVGATRYAICSDSCSEAKHQHNHIHFKCQTCNETTCLDDVNIPSVTLPEGFQVTESNFLITGTCAKCA
ncbi:Fur family transcriptional regulator [Roseivirga misakiensis]|uniref:Fur family transcriptional regulator n=1 Tax=Roseivirga misakiensis TaxID=1563681 RepID=A0A1E5T6H7_9BACT|nr:transcriptional repressor [Roseivirga misakiensis]OEK06979.1 Fur family transcriptional regulator [Roseivirga misakiensis]